jgi:ABC-type multidrug transport system ATPase subunit
VMLTTQYLEEADQLADRVAIIDHGHIVREGAPAALKSEVGSPTLFVTVDHDREPAARDVLASFGELRPSGEGTIGVGLAEGAGEISAVIRRLDDAGIAVHDLQLREPSLDDVFAEATGYRLEGADAATSTTDASSGDGAARAGGRRARRSRARA